MPAIEFEREMSSGHFVRVYRFCIILTDVSEWSHGHGESEWSLMISLMRIILTDRNGTAEDALGVEFVGQVLRDVIGYCANRRNPGGAMSHSGNFSWLDAGREFSVGWRTHHACEPPNTDLDQEVKGTHKRQPSCLESIRVPTMVQGPAALATRSQQKLRR